MAGKTRFLHLGIAVEDGAVRIISKMTIGELLRIRTVPDLGALAGCRAEVTDGAGAHRVGAAVVGGALFLPLALVGLTSKSKASAFVVSQNGAVHEHRVEGARQVRAAQAEAVRFNALAQAAKADCGSTPS